MEGRKHAPQGAEWEAALDAWRALPTDEGAEFDTYVTLNGADIEPCVTWGTTPAQSVNVSGRVPSPDEAANAGAKELAERSLVYMGLEAGTAIQDIQLDRISSAPARIRASKTSALSRPLVKGRKIAGTLSAMVVPGSGLVKMQAEQEASTKSSRMPGRMARSGLLNVPRHEPDILLLPNAAPAPRTATSKAARAAAGAHTSSARRWRLPPPSPATSLTSGIGSNAMKKFEPVKGRSIP